MKALYLTVGLLLPLAALAQPDVIRQELGKCAALADITARVACYDALSRPKTRVETVEHPEEALLDKVASFMEIQPDKLQITLANGQIWQQTIGKAFLIRTNDTVRIGGSGWGSSSRLTIDGHPGFIQVRRLR